MAVPTALTGRVAPPGLWISGGLLLVALCLVPWSLGGATAVAVGAGANLLFFRNPRRVPPAGVENILSPADGRVVEVARLQDPGGFVGAAQRVAIFLSIFNAHVQRVPLSAKVRAVRQRGTRFLAAFNPGASSWNVQTRLDLETPNGTRLALAQITGLVARRVITYAADGEALVRGEPYGVICYGSRVELYVPDSAVLRVRPGDRVRAGETILGELGP